MSGGKVDQDFVRRLTAQVEQLAEDRVERNARIAELDERRAKAEDAYAAQVERNRRLEDALRFYSDGFAYITPGGWKRIWADAGATARAALSPTDSTQKGHTDGDN
jgi:outer membrane murein-binding lipoprotein Lpp